MEPTKPAGGSKPSKVEAIKIASQYLKTFVADEVAQRRLALQRGRGDGPQVPRVVPAGRPRRPHAAEAGGEGEGVPVHGPGPDRRRQARRPTSTWPATSWRGRSATARSRITTRQEFQLHGVLKDDLDGDDPADQRDPALDPGGLRRRRAERPLLPRADPRRRPRRDAGRRRPPGPSHCAPRSSSYWDIWLDGEKIENPLFPARRPDPGPHRRATTRSSRSTARPTCPRKFKTAFALPEDNCTDIHANDLGYLAIVEDGELVGYNVLVGGGLGTTPSAQKTFPFLAVPLCYVDRGRRARRSARRCSRSSATSATAPTASGPGSSTSSTTGACPPSGPRSRSTSATRSPTRSRSTVTDVDDHLGWHEQGDGKLFLGIPVENGRIKDDGRLPAGQRPAGLLREVRHARAADLPAVDPPDRPRAGLAAGDRGAAARSTGSPRVEQVSTVRRWSMACPALPTCGLAVTEAERALPTIMDQLEAELARLGPRGRAVHRADDRLPQRLRPALQRRHRPGRPLGDPQPRRHARARAPTRSSSAAGPWATGSTSSSRTTSRSTGSSPSSSPSSPASRPSGSTARPSATSATGSASRSWPARRPELDPVG